MNLRQLDAWLRLAADRLHDEATTLTQLDKAIGDGDHGINMERGFSAIAAMLDAHAPPNGDNSGQAVGGRLRRVGQTLIKTVGGASGPLFIRGSLPNGIAKVAPSAASCRVSV